MPSRQLHERPRSKVPRTISSCFLMLGTLMAAALSSQPALAYEQEVKQLSAQMAEAITKSGKKTVAVVDFTDLEGNVTELGRFLAEEFSVALYEDAKDFDVIDRTNLKILLQEHKLASTGIIDPQTARRLGEIAGVQALITGNITPFGDSVRLSVKILDTSTAKVLGGFTGEIPRTKAIDELLAKGIAESGRPTKTQNGTSTTPPTPGQASIPNQQSTTMVDDFQIMIRRCERRSDQVRCEGAVANKNDKRLTFNIDYRSSYIVDDTGTQSKYTEVVLGAQRNNGMVLEVDVPINFSLLMQGISENASSVTIVMNINYGEPGYIPMSWKPVTLRGIRLTSR